MASIKIFELKKVSWLKNRKQLKLFLPILCLTEKISLQSINIILCNDEYLLEVNKKFLQHDYFTDIITFNMASAGGIIDGELYISLDRVIDNAKIFKNNNVTELHRVIFHGILHLCGYGDKSREDIVLMRQKEDTYLNLYFNEYYNVPRGTL